MNILKTGELHTLNERVVCYAISTKLLIKKKKRIWTIHDLHIYVNIVSKNPALRKEIMTTKTTLSDSDKREDNKICQSVFGHLASSVSL